MTSIPKHNFGAGPCILPPGVMAQAAAAVSNWNGTGLSILEVSHRSPEFEEVLRQTRQLVKEVMGVPDDYEVLFLQGGASTQFAMVAQNLLQQSASGRAAYIDSGYFAIKAIKQARYFGEVDVIATTEAQDYTAIPKEYTVPADAAYLHFTSNNTIEGTQFTQFPCSGAVPLVCDMSSDIFSRQINVRDFGLIYAGAQKNLGPAGMTLVIISKELLSRIQHEIPAMSDYRVFAANDSMYNTPPVFSIYVAMLNLLWLKDQGGVAGIEARNRKKAALLYEAIDNSSIFYGTAQPADRSIMNVTFNCHTQKHEEGFLKYATDFGIVGIKGYRTVGGFRASLYNALSLHSVEYLIKLMGYYEKQQELKSAVRAKAVLA